MSVPNAAVLLVACVTCQAPSPQETAADHKRFSNGVQCIVQPLKAVDDVGGRHIFSICIRNLSGDDRFISSHGGLLSDTTIHIIGPDGRTPPLTGIGRSITLAGYDRGTTRTRIGPDAQICRTFNIGTMYGLSQPGRYSLRINTSVYLEQSGAHQIRVSDTVEFIVGQHAPVEAPKP